MFRRSGRYTLYLKFNFYQIIFHHTAIVMITFQKFFIQKSKQTKIVAISKIGWKFLSFLSIIVSVWVCYEYKQKTCNYANANVSDSKNKMTEMNKYLCSTALNNLYWNTEQIQNKSLWLALNSHP